MINSTIKVEERKVQRNYKYLRSITIIKNLCYYKIDSMEFKIKERMTFEVRLEKRKEGREKVIKFLTNSEGNEFGLEQYKNKEMPIKLIKYYPFFSANSENGKIIGACASELYGKGLLSIELLAVDNRYRRQGAGLSILKKVLDFAHKNKIHNIQCSSLVSNKESKKFLKKAGFRKVGKLKKYVGKQDYYLWEYLP